MSQPSTSFGPAGPAIPADHTITITPTTPSASPPTARLPRMDLFVGTNREEYIKVGIPLYKAAKKGDWKAAERILKNRPELVRYAITENMETLLHVAASAERAERVEKFVKSLVNFMERADLEIQNQNHDTALILAAQAGNMDIAKTMVNKNPGLIDIPNKQGLLPLYMAALFEKAEMVRYLYDISKNMGGDFWTDVNRNWVLQKCVESEIFDVAIRIVNGHPQLLNRKRLLTDVLLALAQKTEAFEGNETYAVFGIIKSFFSRAKIPGPTETESEALLLLRIIWGKISTMSKYDIDSIIRGPNVEFEREKKENESEVLPYLKRILDIMDTRPKSETNKKNEVKDIRHPSRVLFVATKKGNTRFITEIIRLYPDVVWKVDDKGKTIFHLAIKLRQAKIYNLLYEIGALKDLVTPIRDYKGNNILHMVAKSGKHQQFQNLSGAALHIQSGLLWFKEVEEMIPPIYRKRKNKYGETPQDVFGKTNLLLITKCEKWMKIYLVVATLIATIVFAAAFTLPGGYSQTSGVPYFRNEPSLVIFVISDAISLISSSTSVLILLSILTSNYAEIESLKSLPEKLMFAVATLFLSIMTMMIAFSASFFVLYTGNLKWVPITITCLAGMPIILFGRMQFRLLTSVFYSANRARYLFKPSKRILEN